MRPRPTRDGWVTLVLAVALSVVAWVSSNNVLVLVAAVLWAVLLVALPLGAWNLRGLVVRRVLPAELFAGREASGRLLVRNGRRWMPSGDLRLADLGTVAVGEIALLRPGASAGVLVRWRFAERGPARLGAVEVRSTFPFGLAEHRVVLAAPADLLVYPRPLPASAIGRHRRGAGDVQSERPGGAGDFLGLRRYRPGDNPMRVHWPTTARLDRLVVVERAAETDTAVEVEVKASDRPATWERELSRACGEIHRAFSLGRSVGLLLPAVGPEPARRMPPSLGGGWRRTLLDALARLPRMDP